MLRSNHLKGLPCTPLRSCLDHGSHASSMPQTHFRPAGSALLGLEVTLENPCHFVDPFFLTNLTWSHQVLGASFQRLRGSKKHASDFSNLFVQDAMGVMR